MKILRPNDSELEIRTSGVSTLIFGGIFVLAGIGGAAAPLFTTAEWWVSLIGAAIIALGVLMILTATSIRTLLRKEGASEITEKRLIGGKTKQSTFESSQVNHVKLESHTETRRTTSSASDRSGQQERQRVSTIYLLLNDGTEVTVGTERKNSNGGFALNGISLASISKAPLAAEAQQIADFFGVPLKTGIQDANLQDVIGAVQTAMKQPNGIVAPTAAPTPQVMTQPNPSTPPATPQSTPAQPLAPNDQTRSL